MYYLSRDCCESWKCLWKIFCEKYFSPGISTVNVKTAKTTNLLSEQKPVCDQLLLAVNYVRMIWNPRNSQLYLSKTLDLGWLSRCNCSSEKLQYRHHQNVLHQRPAVSCDKGLIRSFRISVIPSTFCIENFFLLWKIFLISPEHLYLYWHLALTLNTKHRGLLYLSLGFWHWWKVVMAVVMLAINGL